MPHLYMSYKQTRLCSIVLLLLIIAYCFVRDTHIEAQYCGDLRNRIVGARLQLDDNLPYFYKWKPRDGIRYYDPQNFDSLRVANITASPFMHQLLYPLAQLPQKNISFIWLICEYVMLITMLALALAMCTKNVQLIAIVTIAGIFLNTNAWLQHIANGQIYLILPFLSIFFLTFLQSKQYINLFFCGICAIMLVAIRPTYVLFFLPIFFIIIKIKWKQICIFIMPSIVMISFILLNKQQSLLWLNYKNGIVEQIKLHQGLNPDKQYNATSPNYLIWEGYDMAEIDSLTKKNTITIQTNIGNFFALYKAVFHKNIKIAILNSLLLVLIALLLVAFLYKHGVKQPPNLINTALWGFCMYVISEFLSPIHRHPYNAVIWLFPLLLMALQYNKSQQWILGALIGCLILTVNAIAIIGLPSVIGEYGMWIVIITHLLTQTQFNAHLKVKTIS